LSRGRHETTDLDRSRDELFSHIQRCGVIEAEDAQRGEWLDDTIQYLAERYSDLSKQDLVALKEMGERYCSPAIPHGYTKAKDGEADVAEEESDAKTSEVSAA